MENIRNFIDLVGAGQNSEAKDALEEILSAKAFDSLDGRKKDIANSLYAGEQPESSDEEHSNEEQETE